MEVEDIKIVPMKTSPNTPRKRKWAVRPQNALRRKKGISPYVKAKKASKVAKMRLWGMPSHWNSAYLRYQNPVEKGILWYWVSLYVRTRDVVRWGGCISCGRAITVGTCDAGHFVPAGSCGNALLFDETNLNAECSHCNAWDDMHLIGYSAGLNARYGAGTAETLKARRPAKGSVSKNLSPHEYEDLIQLYQAKVIALG